MREQAERDILTIQGEAEREAHRLTSAARREAEDLLRTATMDAEKTASDAARRRDDIIDQANRQAAAAQERTRALEQRRDELMEELESVRATLSRLEGSLEERRESLELSSQESTSVRVVPPSREKEPPPEHWELGETVRVVRPDDEHPEHVVDIDLPDQDIEPRPEIEPIGVQRPAVEVIEAPQARGKPEPNPEPFAEMEPEPEPEAPVAEVAETEGGDEPEQVEDEPTQEAVTMPPGKSDDLGALFQALRGSGRVAEEAGSAGEAETEASEEQGAAGPQVEAAGESGEVDSGRDWIEVRDARLLPITNRALRGAKKALTELQNIALDGIRTEEDWRPDENVIGETLQAELIAVWAESFAAGHAVAEEMTDSKIKRPATPFADSVPLFARALAKAVEGALDDAGDGQRARQAAASRVFRVWRTDEAERRIRELAIRAYELGVERSVGVDASIG